MAVAEFAVYEVFSMGSSIKRPGMILEVSEAKLKEEVAKGLHESGKPISGLLNHCAAMNDIAKEAVKGMKVKAYLPESETSDEEQRKLNEEAKKKEIDELRKEFDKIGKAYDPHWSGKRLRMELEKAKKEAPEPSPAAKKKIEKVE